MVKISKQHKSHAKQSVFLSVIIVLSVGLFFALFHGGTAHAHSTLLEMEPAEDVVTQEPPSEITLRFNEPVEHDLALVTVYDWNADPVFTGNPDNNDTERSPSLEFTLPELEEGTYTVKWNVVSADGHPVDGSYAFAVGEATEGGVKSAGADSDAEGLLILSRLLPEGLLLVGAGLFWFSWLAERRKFPSLDILWKKKRSIGAILIILGSISELIAYSASLPPGILGVILNGRWELLLDFPFVLMLFAQLFFLLLLFIPGMERGWYLTLWLALAATPAFGGHVWGMEYPFVALVPRILHQLSIAFWLGALVYVLFLLIGQQKKNTNISWTAFRPFFVRRMLVASSLVILTGLVMVWLQSGLTGVFTDWKTWSVLVILKILLTLTMLSMALFQTLKWRRMQDFLTRRTVRIEWLIGIVVLVLGIWMSQIAYPIAVETYDETLTTNQVETDVYIGQLQVGDREMMADIATLEGEEPEEVQAKVSMPQHDMDSGQLDVEPNDSGYYTIDLPFTMSGTWLLEITATYPDNEKMEWKDEMFIAEENN